MAYITNEEYIAAIGGYSFLEKAAKMLAEDFEKEFVGGAKYTYLQDIDIEGDEITGEINLSFDVHYCGCCSPDYESYTLPISYLWDDNWKEREKEIRAKQQQIRDEQKAKQDIEEKKKTKERRYKQYLAMKKEYEG